MTESLEPLLPPSSLRRVMPAVLTLVAFTGVVVCVSTAPLIWDGAYQLVETLYLQRPYVYETRFHTRLIWWPTVWVSRMTENVNVIQAVYGLPFMAAPVAGLGLSWWVVKRDAPHLIVWAAFGVLAAPLPGQIFVINDSAFQQHLFWPVFMGLFVPLTWPKRIVLGLLLVFQFVHPIGIILGAGGAVTAFALLCIQRDRRRELVAWVLVLTAVAVGSYWKLRVWPDSYAAAEFTRDAAISRWRMGVAGSPIRGLILLAAGAVGIVLRDRVSADDKRRRDVSITLFVLLAAGGGVWLFWGVAQADHWIGWALDYRRWLVPLSVPFYLMALLDALAPLPRDPGRLADLTRGRATAVAILATVFAGVLCTQSVIWCIRSKAFLSAVAAEPGPIVRKSELPVRVDRIGNHWALTSLVMLAEGKTPTRLLVLDPRQDPPLESPVPAVPYTPYDTLPPEPGPSGWFDHRPLLERHARNRRVPD